MKAALFHKESGDLIISNKNIPNLSDKDVLVKVHYCSFCGHDLAVIQGMLKRGVGSEVILGHELSGIVDSVGSQVSTCSPGDRVVSLLTNSCGICDRCLNDQSHRCRVGEGIGHTCDGGFAEYVVVSENSVFKIHDDLTLKDACMLVCPIGVIEEAFSRYKGQFNTAVVSGATGGLGIHGIQKASSLFDRVIALTTDASADKFLSQNGATDVVVYDASDTFKFKEIIMALTEDEGVDLFIDPVGSGLFNESVACVSQYGCLMLLGDIQGIPLDIHLGDMLFKDLEIICSTGSNRESVKLAERMILNGDMKPIIFDVVALENILDVCIKMQESSVIGRILIDMTLG
ncbi:MAG: zinc-binding dehydrogenase [SAR202 cluster bacterium]|nr:zinc-binding dehydrogenase [SAR202 cluster bacterium]MQG36179.1 zinc-binding dehydrogenase [SAR202 cluster bacterium]MQG85880.1 zinc-binding dehydrogenase [SAR202 cluster bacterium]|tara:strand:- start:34491 stop:35525 length:1035 start_codon:yes stop_codon:yes gene_type:complete